MVVSAAAAMRDPQSLLGLVASRFDMHLVTDGCADAVVFSLMGGADARLAALAAATHPECTELLRELEAVADMPSGDALPSSLRAPPAADSAQVSIVVPCFNDGEFLLEAIASVERAVSVPYELIVVNDGSVETRTLAILACLRQAGYRIIDQDNLGLAEARNRGVREASCR